MHLRPPLGTQQPQRVARLPRTLPGGVLWQAKMDGYRTVTFVDDDSQVALQTRAGRLVTEHFPELLPCLRELPAGTVLDGETIALRGEVLDFDALAATPERRAPEVTVVYVAFDLLETDGEVLVDLPLQERWQRLQALLADRPPGLALVFATHERAAAMGWLQALAPLGVEGVVGKSLSAPYRAGLGGGWYKYRRTDTTDGTVVDIVEGTALRVLLDDGATVTTAPLTQLQMRALRADVESRDEVPAYVNEPLRVEVHVGTGRNTRIDFVRVRPDR